MDTTQTTAITSLQTLTDQAVRSAIRVKFNRTYGWSCASWNGLTKSVAELPPKEARQCLREFSVCDPKADNGRFLVAALQELLCIVTEWDLVRDPAGKSVKNIHLEKVDGEISLKKEKRSTTALARIYDSLFLEAIDIARHNLYGVALDPLICRVQLENELLTFSHTPSEDKEALPDLSNNLRQGDSLLKRFQLTTDLTKMLKGNKARLGLYLSAIRLFREANNPVSREEAWGIFSDMHKNFQSHLRPSDPDYVRLKQLEYRLSLKSNPLFGQFQLPEATTKQIRLERDIERLRGKLEEAAGRKPTFEWRYAFPGVLSPQDGRFEGFSLVLANAPEEKNEDTVSPWIELATEISNDQLAMVLPDDFFRSKRYRLTNRKLLRDFDVTGLEEVDGTEFEAQSTGKLLVRLAKNSIQ